MAGIGGARWGVLVALFVLSGCEEARKLVEKVDKIATGEETWTAPEGSEASAFFARSANRDVSTDINAVLEAMKVSQTEKATANLRAAGLLGYLAEDTVEVSEDAAKILEKIAQSKKKLKPDDFNRPEQSTMLPSAAGLVGNPQYYHFADTVTLQSGYTDFTISTLKKMPVRDQGRRGTCAAFAGIGQIEGLVLKAYPDLGSIDLSEQRFYYMSKPDHWNSGGDINSGGSNSGTGFAKSHPSTTSYESEYTWSDGSTKGYKPEHTPTGTSVFTIPTEGQCTYVAKKVDNDVQIPQDTGCKNQGVVRVDDFVAWVYNWNNRPATAQEIYDHLVATDAPVVVFTKLSSNWEQNDGMVTKADADAAGEGASSHSAGHAYLVVGARALDTTEFPNEGGMCFVIKNSWGKGWGVNGYSCMTLAWFNEWRFSGGFPQALSVTLDESSFSVAKQEEDVAPDNETVEEPDDDTKVVINDGVKKRGSLSFFTEENVSAADLSLGYLLNDNDEISKILYRINADTFTLRGLLSGGTKQTHEISLRYDDGKLTKDFAGKGRLQVGSWDAENKVLTLCSQEFSAVCLFYYLESSNQLLVEITEEEFLRDDSEGPYTWRTLSVAGKGIEINFPDNLSTRIDLRFKVDGSTTNPLRFAVRPLSGDIMYQGKAVGNYQNASMCTGDYEDLCRMVRTKERFMVLFRSGKGS